jgi:integrase
MDARFHGNDNVEKLQTSFGIWIWETLHKTLKLPVIECLLSYVLLIQTAMIQELLGHSHSKTTEIYTLVREQLLRGIKNPLDFIKIEKVVNPYEK